MMKRALLVLAAILACVLPAHAFNGNGFDQDSFDSPTLSGAVTIGESLGPELITLDATCTGWTLASGWTCASGTLAHDGAGTGTATYTAAGVVGTSYRITHTSTITVSTGGYTLAIGGGTTASRTAAVTAQEDRVTASATTVFTITPGNTAFRGVISALSLKEITSTITPGSGAVIVSKTLADATANEAALRVVGNQTGAAGNKSVISAHYVGTPGSGTEYLYEGWNGTARNFSVTTAGEVQALSSVSALQINANHSAPTTGGAFYSNGQLTNIANAVYVYSGKPAIHSAGTDLEGVRMFPDLSNNHTGGNWISYSAPDLVSADADIVKYGVKIGTGYDSAFYATNANNAGSGYNQVTLAPTLAAMDGSDTVNLLNLAPTNADHTGSGNTLNGINIGAITGDAQATESVIVVGSGWDYFLNSPTARLTSTAAAWVFQGSSATLGNGIDQSSDFTGANFFYVSQSASDKELTGTGVQNYLTVQPEVAQSGAGGYNAVHVLVGEPTPYTGSGGSGAQNLLLLETGHEDFSSPVERFKVARTGEITQGAVVKRYAFTKTPLTNNSAIDLFTITIGTGELVTGHLTYGINSTGGSSDLQAHSGMVTFACVNKGGTVTKDIDEVYLAASETSILTAGTQADTWAMKAGDVCTVTLNVNSSLSSAVNSVQGEIVINSAKTITLN